MAVKAGQDFTITLCSNGSTGYAWEEPAISGSAGVTLVDRQPVKPPAGAPLGAAGAEEFTFRAASAGPATIDFSFGQPWEGGDKGAWKARVTVDAS